MFVSRVTIRYSNNLLAQEKTWRVYFGPIFEADVFWFVLQRYTDNQLAQDAMNLTFFHWGVHGWIVYVVVGLLLAFVCYRQGLPMTVRSCFYPLIGDMIYGWMGDVIDILSICGTMFGVCTSLGLGAIQLNAGNVIS